MWNNYLYDQNFNIYQIDEYKLYQNITYPFNSGSLIVYEISNDAFVTLKVYDILGKEIAISVDILQTIGKYSIY